MISWIRGMIQWYCQVEYNPVTCVKCISTPFQLEVICHLWLGRGSRAARYHKISHIFVWFSEFQWNSISLAFRAISIKKGSKEVSCQRQCLSLSTNLLANIIQTPVCGQMPSLLAVKFKRSIIGNSMPTNRQQFHGIFEILWKFKKIDGNVKSNAKPLQVKC
jgi:hypothetical protein